MPRAAASHPIFARFYARVSPKMDEAGMAVHRADLVAGLAGSVVDIGVGDGASFDHYPKEVTSALGIEPEPFLREIARRRSRRAPVPVDVVDGTAEQLPAGNGSFDAAVVSLVLCSVSNQAAVLDEISRVLRPGGELRFLEHVRAEGTCLRWVQRMADASIWPLLGGGCRSGRDTVKAIQDAGFTIAWFDRFKFPETAVSLPTSAHVLGVAHRPRTICPRDHGDTSNTT